MQQSDNDDEWGFCQVLLDNEYQEYVKDPFNDMKAMRVKEALSAPASDDKTQTIYPPFYLTYQRMAREPGTALPTWNFTGEHRNQVLFLPVIATYLFAGIKNLTPGEVAGDVTLVDMINYMVQHHCGPESGQSNVTSVHPTYKSQYDFPGSTQYKVYHCRDDHQIIPATLFIVHMLNATIAQGSVGNEHDLDNTKKRLEEMATLFEGAFNMILSKGNTKTSAKSHVWHFGKFKFEISHFQSYTSKKTNFYIKITSSCNTFQVSYISEKNIFFKKKNNTSTLTT